MIHARRVTIRDGLCNLLNSHASDVQIANVRQRNITG